MPIIASGIEFPLVSFFIEAEIQSAAIKPSNITGQPGTFTYLLSIVTHQLVILPVNTDYLKLPKYYQVSSIVT